MKNIKLFEAFSEEYYKKALDNIKALVNKDAPKKDILNYISKFTGEDAKLLNQLRIVIDRVKRETDRCTYGLHLEKSTKSIKKRTDGSDWDGTWRAGDVVVRTNYGKSLRYYAFSKDRQKEFSELVSNQKRQYLHLKDIITIDISRITFFADRMFEILDWCVETGVSKMAILHNHQDDVQKKTELENLNDFDMENECDEIILLSTRIKADISTLVNSIS